ncbi:MAG: Re/Si-specific NAD(P)(+) transhydrogenase subunit alpha [Pseudonocardiales bacterium]|nr:MAG: Re/Si-specific NAD(P)(+) transhydrogenase subunit alpha [Pseudonocardiales bacterium]
MAALRVGVVKEVATGERRVALTPDVVVKLKDAGLEILVQAGAGAGAWFPDERYEQAGATIVDGTKLYADADVLLAVGLPDTAQLRSGQTVVALLQPLLNAELMAQLAQQGVTAVSLDGLPRTLTRAQGMDALSSQANVAGYKAVLVAADSFHRFFPLLITAAGTSRPAEVLVLGAGVAGLQAIGTAKRLGAIVRGYDVRPASREEVKSLGGQFVELTSVESGAGEGGYARALSPEEQAAQQAELTDHIVKHDIVITTAQVPGRRPPLMVTKDAVARMKAGSVILDMAASDLGGNVEISRPGETFVTDNGVTVIGAGTLPSLMATSASNAYSRNISALLLHLVSDGALAIDQLITDSDEIAAGVVVTHGGSVVQPATAALLEKESAP